MRTPAFLIRMVSVLAVMGLGLMTSCLEDEPEFAKEAGYAIEESNIDAYYADADDMAGVAVSESEETEGGREASGARQLETDDIRFCNSLSVTLDLDLSTLLRPVGDIVIDFGSSCEDGLGNVRSGKVKVHFEGKRFQPNSLISITFENYQINGIKLNGIRTLTNLPNSTLVQPKFQVELENGSVEWDGKIATREHCLIGTWDRGVLLDPTDDVLRVTECSGAVEAASGTNRNGVDYQVFIEEELIYKRGCPLALSGIKKFLETDSGKEIIIDYGSGTCDAVFTITVNGDIRNIHGKR